MNKGIRAYEILDRNIKGGRENAEHRESLIFKRIRREKKELRKTLGKNHVYYCASLRINTVKTSTRN